MATTKYTIFVNDTAVDGSTKATKATVVAAADTLRKKGEKGAIDVRTGAGTVVHSLKAVKARIVTKHTKPYTKVLADLPKEIAALVPAGYVAAYERPRNDALVLRNEGAEDDERYAVARRSTGEFVGFAPTTRAAGQIMKGMKVPA
jgi:hypothetical protein